MRDPLASQSRHYAGLAMREAFLACGFFSEAAVAALEGLAFGPLNFAPRAGYLCPATGCHHSAAAIAALCERGLAVRFERRKGHLFVRLTVAGADISRRLAGLPKAENRGRADRRAAPQLHHRDERPSL